MYQVSVAESINRILKTPLGSRVMRPDFGSKLYELRDRKLNDEYKLKAIRYTYEAITKWEPRVKMDKVSFEIEPISGKTVISVHLKNGEVVKVNND